MIILLQKPLKYCVITQPFGVNWTGISDMYSKFGLKDHNGDDFKIAKIDEHYEDGKASHHGTVTRAELDENGFGWFVELTDESGLFKTRYAHGEKVLVSKTNKVKAGQSLIVCDNTGNSTGPHLHFDLKFLNPDGSIKNYNNGYFGCVDPAPYFEKSWLNLPVDERYGRKRNLQAEILLRFKNAWVHRRLIKKYRRHPLQLFDRECNAIIYGGWGFDEALNDTMKPITYFLKKTAWQEGQEPYLKLYIG